MTEELRESGGGTRGNFARERLRAGGKKSCRVRKARCKSRASAYFCAQEEDFWQLGKDGEVVWQTVGEAFFTFCQKIKDGEEG